NDGIALAVEIDKNAIEKRIRHGYLQTFVDDLDEALDLVQQAKHDRVPRSSGILGKAGGGQPERLRSRIIPDIVTDQTSAHDPLNGYYPAGLSKDEADSLRGSNPEEYLKRARRSIRTHVKTMIAMSRRGAVAFEYGNNIRQQALDAGLKNAFEFPGFVQRYIRPMFCEGRGPFRWTSLVGDPEDIRKIDELVLSAFPHDKGLARWIRKAQKEVKFQGLPARESWLGFGERAKFGGLINEMVANEEHAGPIWIGRDHLDCGSVASPRRETEGMLDGSDAIADWPILNALLTTAAGASWWP